MTETRAMTVLQAKDVQQTAEYLRDELGFRIDLIFPADDPSSAEMNGHGLQLLIERADVRDQTRLQIRTACADLLKRTQPVIAPNGTLIEIARDEDTLEIPALVPDLVVSKADDPVTWVQGRAGMQYRDLIPGRLGGRFIASHIRIPDGGPVPDYVHYHQIRFQLIYCYRGWVKVVYEDQGAPFVMHAGDCVLQPPLIRHRVLESSPGLEVVEIGCPAEHYTRVDHDLVLPNPTNNPGRDFSGQRFARHQASSTGWRAWTTPGYEVQDCGIGTATDQLAGVRRVRASKSALPVAISHDREFQFWFVLEGEMEIRFDHNQTLVLGKADSIVVPADMTGEMKPLQQGLQFLEVSLPS